MRARGLNGLRARCNQVPEPVPGGAQSA